jgi:hypothetical protein
MACPDNQFTISPKDAAQFGYLIVGLLSKILSDPQESSPTEHVPVFVSVRNQARSKQEVIDVAEVPAVEMLIEVGSEWTVEMILFGQNQVQFAVGSDQVPHAFKCVEWLFQVLEDVPAEDDIPYSPGYVLQILDDAKAPLPAGIQGLFADIPAAGIRQPSDSLSNAAPVLEHAKLSLGSREIETGLDLGPRPEIFVICDQIWESGRMIVFIIIRICRDH